MSVLRRAFAAIVLLAAPAACQPSSFYLHDGDRVLFHGDSITEGRHYNGFVETFVTTRFPKMNIAFVHHGWGGDKVTGGPGGPIEVRVKRDVIAWKPTVVAIMLGMNDGEYRAPDPAIQSAYAAGFTYVVRTLKSALPGVRITAMRPSPYDEVSRGLVYPHSYNQVLVNFGEFIERLGREEGLLVADMNAPLVSLLAKAKAIDPEAAGRLIPDHVHPELAMHLLLAGELLKAWHAPAVVSAVEIDAAQARVVAAENTAVRSLKAGSGAISWTAHDNALPMPVDRQDPLFRLALSISDFDQTLNRQPLKVSGLKPGRYSLKIDGAEIGSFDAGALEAGVNLALFNTPMAKQAAEVHGLMAKHNKVHYFRWRLPVPLEGDEDWPQLKDAVRSMDGLEAEYVRHQRAAAQTTPHRFEVLRIEN
jgi:lysophospholipase L1-like esterase